MRIEVPTRVLELCRHRLHTALQQRDLGVLRFDLSVAVALFSSTLVERLLELRDKGLLVLELVLDIAELSLAFGAHLLYFILCLLGRTLKRLHLLGAFSESTFGSPSRGLEFGNPRSVLISFSDQRLDARGRFAFRALSPCKQSPVLVLGRFKACLEALDLCLQLQGMY